jgi:NifU-like protein involved in Fe-S cluster formation
VEAVMNAPLYTVEILRIAASLPEPVELARIDGSGEARSPACGSSLVTSVALTPDGRVEAMSQQVHACAFGQASAALVAGSANGRSRDDVERALGALSAWLDGGEALPDWPGMTALLPARARKPRHGAILLPLRALLAAMDDAR